MKRPLVVIGLLGSTLDRGAARRWEKWRPTVSLAQQEDLLVDRLELLHQPQFSKLADVIADDVRTQSPSTEVRLHELEFSDPWDLEPTYAALYDFARTYPFDPEKEDYLVHITTGTHVAQICLFLLAESHHLPARLIQTRPSGRKEVPGEYEIIDLDLSTYDQIARRFAQEAAEEVSFLKAGIETKNAAFNDLMLQIERVATVSQAPVLLLGPTGVGKTLLARRIFELKRRKRQFTGRMVEVNCATLRGDAAMSALFGHRRGAFTGAVENRDGLLRAADKGMLFLDEIGELGLDEQAMLLRAIEEKRFLPVGSDNEVRSEFQLIAGTHRNLHQAAKKGEFREDLLARIDLWTFEMPSLRERQEDIEPNIDYELERFGEVNGDRITFNKEARAAYLRFASHDAVWAANFRDLNASMTRMATLAPGGRINTDTVKDEITRLERQWGVGSSALDLCSELLGEKSDEIDRFDRVQLNDVLRVCLESQTLSEAGRALFAASRKNKANPNDADRLRKYLLRFQLDFRDIQNAILTQQK
jgi:transcriptional regulatory protein RtcR